MTDLFPHIQTPEQIEAMNKAIQDRDHLDYLCYLHLKSLLAAIPAEELVELLSKQGWLEREEAEAWAGEAQDLVDAREEKNNQFVGMVNGQSNS